MPVSRGPDSRDPVEGKNGHGTEALLERLERLDTCGVSDSLDHLSLEGVTMGIHPLWPCPKIAGWVVTVKVVPAGPAKPSVHLAAPAIEAAGRGAVIVIDTAGRTDVSSWGDILSNAAQVKGIRGVVIDGGCRTSTVAARSASPSMVERSCR